MTTKEFIQYAGERPELCEKLSACTKPEEAFAIAKGEGLIDDMATFTAVMDAAKKEVEALSEADLDKVSAAVNASSVVGTVTVSVVSAASVGVAAAAVAV